MSEKKTREQVQEEAYQAWKNAGKRGTLEIITGLGKTKIAMDAIAELPKTAKILFLAEATDRELELTNEKKKWKVKHEVVFMCYQSAYKLQDTEWDLVIADEIHDSLTPVYSAFYFNNKYKYIMGLSATVDANALIEVEDGDDTNKGDMLKTIAPICYSYSLDDGQRDGTARKLKVYIIAHKLDTTTKNITGGSKAKPFMQTEYAAYQYKDKMFKQALFLDSSIRGFRIQTTSAARAKLLYELPSKVDAITKLLTGLSKPTLIFGNSINSLLKITPNCISSRNSDKKNDSIRSKFDRGVIKLVAAFKKLKQGANLVGLDNVILHSYYSKDKDMIQRIGRMRNDGTVGKVFIFLTTGTQEEKWYTMMMEDHSSISPIFCTSVDDCLLKLRR